MSLQPFRQIEHSVVVRWAFGLRVTTREGRPAADGNRGHFRSGPPPSNTDPGLRVNGSRQGILDMISQHVKATKVVQRKILQSLSTAILPAGLARNQMEIRSCTPSNRFVATKGCPLWTDTSVRLHVLNGSGQSPPTVSRSPSDEVASFQSDTPMRRSRCTLPDETAEDLLENQSSGEYHRFTIAPGRSAREFCPASVFLRA